MAENNPAVVGVLKRGQVSTEKLTALLGRYELPDEIMILVKGINGDLAEAVSMLQNDVVAASPVGSDENGMCVNLGKKRKAIPKTCSRKRADRNSSQKIIKESMDDGFTWRKYGQKEIFSAKHPRNYFRCTHKYEENCQATRQVQMSEQQPQMYEITYFGEHTCKQAKKHCQERENLYIINFNSNTNKIPNQYISPSNSSPPQSSSIKHEQDEEVMSNQTSSASFSTTPDQAIPGGDFPELEPILTTEDSFSMQLDGNTSLYVDNFESILSECQFGYYFQD